MVVEAENKDEIKDYISSRKDLRKHSERHYPLLNAKENITLKCFLKKI